MKKAINISQENDQRESRKQSTSVNKTNKSGQEKKPSCFSEEEATNSSRILKSYDQEHGDTLSLHATIGRSQQPAASKDLQNPPDNYDPRFSWNE
jgi:hypothetical protein